ncbi:Guanylate kinase [Pseudidiomarina piscicola]|uniref:Guanylate kinase n=1 Tax=Pseudidiomarina piscicola TaxID=2614830 RepID=A0A6S6WPZ6_9GAMM|nr:guanylate kinase [Pseudidiomarina piscicola]CAB0151325.1 Guanylate kinase [Pseudidiomarina piscicola]VZT40806.1 Guanylate kinase [Pseudomonas aeruginosa]
MTTTPAAADGNLFIVAAPSGAGKSSLIRALLERHNDGSMQVSVSCTTRAPRPGEIDGVHYHFLDVDTFQRKIEANAFYEWAKVFDNYYGTSRVVIEETLKQGIDVFLDIDWQGARQVRDAYPQAQSIFIVPPNLQVLEQRLRSRGQDSDDTIRARMAKAQTEMSHYHEFDYLLVNGDFTDTLANFEHIVMARRQRIALQQQRHAAKLKDLLANDE